MLHNRRMMLPIHLLVSNVRAAVELAQLFGQLIVQYRLMSLLPLFPSLLFCHPFHPLSLHYVFICHCPSSCFATVSSIVLWIGWPPKRLSEIGFSKTFWWHVCVLVQGLTRSDCAFGKGG
jgi:hypothetical protein